MRACSCCVNAKELTRAMTLMAGTTLWGPDGRLYHELGGSKWALCDEG